MKLKKINVVIEKNDLDKIKLKTTKSIDIKEFVDSPYIYRKELLYCS